MEIKERTPIEPSIEPPKAPQSVAQQIVVHPKPKAGAVAELPPFHIHHSIVGAGIIGASALVFFIPDLKPMTKYIVAGLGATIGAALVYDDLVQHTENNCEFSTIINFIPCEKRVVKKVLAPPAGTFPVPFDLAPEMPKVAPATEAEKTGA